MAEFEGDGGTIHESAPNISPSQLNTGSDMLVASIEAASAFNLFREKINLVLEELNQQTVINDVDRLKRDWSYLLIRVQQLEGQTIRGEGGAGSPATNRAPAFTTLTGEE